MEKIHQPWAILNWDFLSIIFFLWNLHHWNSDMFSAQGCPPYWILQNLGMFGGIVRPRGTLLNTILFPNMPIVLQQVPIAIETICYPFMLKLCYCFLLLSLDLMKVESLLHSFIEYNTTPWKQRYILIVFFLMSWILNKWSCCFRVYFLLFVLLFLFKEIQVSLYCVFGSIWFYGLKVDIVNNYHHHNRFNKWHLIF